MRVMVVSLVLILVGAAMAGCGSAAGRSGSRGPGSTSTGVGPGVTSVAGRAATPPATQPDGALRSSGGCVAFPAGTHTGQTVARTLASGGRERSYRVHVPKGVEATTRLAIVLNFHGLGSGALEQEVYSGLVPVSDREGFLLVSPDGTGVPRAWSSFRELPTGADDVLFVNDLLDALGADFCVDEGAVFATGMSNGGFMSSLLGCVLADRVAAVAPVAGLYYPGEDCPATVAVLAFHGTEDAVVPYDGGNVLGLLRYAGVRASLDGWVARGGCEPEFRDETLATGVTRTTLTGCASAAAALVTIDGGGHTWPGAPAIGRLGMTTQAVSAAELIWAFFEANRR